MKIKTALILAAGEGSRLVTQKLSAPKPLQVCKELSLAERSLLTLKRHGVDQFFITLGYKKDEVAVHFQDIALRWQLKIELIEVSEWEKGNGVSALAAYSHLKDSSFLLTMVDHMFEDKFISQFLSSLKKDENVTLAVDFQPSQTIDLVDATKVQVIDSYITKIGKELTVWQGIDTGLFYCTPILFRALQDACQNKLYSLSHGMQYLADQRKLRAIDVSSERWFDIDTPQDMLRAQKIFT